MKLHNEKRHCILRSHYDQLRAMRGACSIHATHAYTISVVAAYTMLQIRILFCIWMFLRISRIYRGVGLSYLHWDITTLYKGEIVPQIGLWRQKIFLKNS